VNPRTLTNLLRQHGVEPNADGRFTTRQICQALYGDIKMEKLGETRARRLLLESELAERNRDLVRVSELAEVVNKGISSIKATINSAANMEREDKDKIIRACGELWAGAFGVSAADAAVVEPAAEV